MNGGSVFRKARDTEADCPACITGPKIHPTFPSPFCFDLCFSSFFFPLSSSLGGLSPSIISSFVTFFQYTRGSYYVTKPAGTWPWPPAKAVLWSGNCREGSRSLLQGFIEQSLSFGLTQRKSSGDLDSNLPLPS